MKETEEQINEALIQSLEKWNKVVKKFRVSIKDKGNWFQNHCQGNTCPLCQATGDCDDCPIFDGQTSEVACCKEWFVAAGKDDNLKPKHLKAVRDRIKNECLKRGLI